MRVNVVMFHLAVASFAACDITSVIHSGLVMKFFEQREGAFNDRLITGGGGSLKWAKI